MYSRGTIRQQTADSRQQTADSRQQTNVKLYSYKTIE